MEKIKVKGDILFGLFLLSYKRRTRLLYRNGTEEKEWNQYHEEQILVKFNDKSCFVCKYHTYFYLQGDLVDFEHNEWNCLRGTLHEGDTFISKLSNNNLHIQIWKANNVSWHHYLQWRRIW